MTSSKDQATTATTDSGIPVESHEYSLTVGQTARCCSRTTT